MVFCKRCLPPFLSRLILRLTCFMQWHWSKSRNSIKVRRKKLSRAKILSTRVTAQYNAWCLKNGNHCTVNRGHVNWNAGLNWKMRTELAFQWEVFEDDIKETLESLVAFVKEGLRDLERYLDGEADE